MGNRCPKCNTDNPPDSKFCKECATPLPGAEGVSFTKTMETPRDELTTGSLFAGRYQIIEELGKGGMGRVYKALDKETNEKIALKLIKSEIATDKKTIERFRKELTTARKIGHRNVCRMFDLNKAGSNYYITMEYVSGGDLKKFIRRSKQLSIGTAISIAKQICTGLEEAHRLGIVHRDLKPNNIMIDDHGNAKIMDFGIARTLKEKSITGSGVMIGTPEYMSPEQVEAKDVDQRSDIYSLGVIMYEMVTGRLPFEADTPFAVGVKHKSEVPKSPKKFNPQISEDFNGVILKCLEKGKGDRYQDAGGLRSDLEKIEMGPPTTDRIIPKNKPLTSRELTFQLNLKKLIIPGIAILALGVVALLIWSPWARKQQSLIPSDKPTLAVAYFDNRIDESELDKDIIEMFFINLGRFDNIRVLSQQLLSGIFSQMRTDDSQKIDESNALQVARKAGADYIVAGSIFKVGENIKMTTQLIGVQEGENIAYDDTEGSLNNIGKMIDNLTEKLSLELGLTRDDPDSVRIVDVTTSSPEAFEHYRKGVTYLLRVEAGKAREELEKAIGIDPKFAAAYVYLSFAQFHLASSWNPFTDMTESRKILNEAKKLSYKIRDQERMMIEVQEAMYERDSQKYQDRALAFVQKYPENELANFSLYMAYVGNNKFRSAKEVMEKYLQVNPSHVFTRMMLSYAEARLDNFIEALVAINTCIALEPDNLNSYDSGWEISMISAEYEKAFEFCQKALAKFPETLGYYWKMGYTHLIMGDVESARSMFRLYYSKGLQTPSREEDLNWFLGISELYRGNLTSACKEFEKNIKIAKKQGWYGTESLNLLALGKILVYQGNYYEAISTFEEAEKTSWKRGNKSFNPFPIFCRYYIGLAQIEMGNLDLAQQSTEAIKRFINEQGLEDFYLSFVFLLEGAIQSVEKNGTAVLELINKCTEIHTHGPEFILLSAEAALLMKNYDLAIEHFKKLRTDITMTRYGNDVVFFFRCSSLTDYNLGKVYEQLGNTLQARLCFEKFLELWKDADPGLPEVEDAKTRLAGLKNR